METPLLPNLPVLPILCTYSFVVLGKSKLITRETWLISKPLDPISVHTRTLYLQLLNSFIFSSRSLQDISEVSELTEKLKYFNLSVNQLALFLVFTKMIDCPTIKDSNISMRASSLLLSDGSYTMNYDISDMGTLNFGSNIHFGSFINCFATSNTVLGKVAEHNTIYNGGRYLQIS